MSETAPWLLVGLGNPGPRYAKTRHNVGFMVVEAWLSRHPTPGASEWRDKFHARCATASGPGGRCVVLQPQTFMNRSGKSVAAAASFYRVPLDRIIVVHDELDFDFGRVAIKVGGGHGGHNGLRDIVETLGANGFLRVRVGVGRPARGDVTSWLLSDFGPEDAAELPDLVDRAQEAVTCIMTLGVTAAMNKFNQMTGGPPRAS